MAGHVQGDPDTAGDPGRADGAAPEAGEPGRADGEAPEAWRDRPPGMPADAARAGGAAPAAAGPSDAAGLPTFPARPGRLRTTPLRGMAMGLADSVPGVSGGTVALILGIHPRLVRAIAAIDISIATALVAGRDKAKRAWQHADLGFLALLALGIAIGILAGFTLLSVVLERWPAALMALLLGLVAASIHIPARVPEWRARDVLLATATGLVALVIGVVPGLLAPQALWFLPIAGAIAACAMILPGISGSYLLLLMGLFESIAHAGSGVAHGLAGQGPLLAPLTILGLVAVGALVGLLAFSRGLRHMLDRHPGPTHAAMVGLLAGSLVRLWPWRDAPGFAQGAPVVPDAALPAVFLLVGILAGWGLDRVGRMTS